MEKVYSPKEVAECLGVTVRSVYNYMNAGKLETFKTASGSRRIRESAVSSFLNGGDTSTAQKSDNLK